MQSQHAPKLEVQLADAEAELHRLDQRRTELADHVAHLRREIHNQCQTVAEPASPYTTAAVTRFSPEQDKVKLFRSLFRGREDVYPQRFESMRSGKSGYQPHCANEWLTGLCAKPKVKCKDCSNRQFIPFTDTTAHNHLLGREPGRQRDFIAGVYPMLADETCWFVAADFDKQNWRDDALAFAETCRHFNIAAAVERSRSGNGAHVWIFFAEPVPARIARQLACMVLTETMERRPEIGLDSYDRLFPNQDNMPQGGFGNLIALPLQNKPRSNGNSVFIDEHLQPFADQWAFLSTLRRMPRSEIELLVDNAAKQGRILGIKLAIPGDDDDEPWSAPASRRRKPDAIPGILPKTIDLVLANQVYIPKKDLPAALLNRLVRIAAFQNPEFYKRQAMRTATYDTPRVIGCAEEFPLHLGLPRGCLDDVRNCFAELGIAATTEDKRFTGNKIKVHFVGKLRPEQKTAAQAILQHDTGVLSATTAFGKTVIAAYLIARRKVNTLILVHTRELLDQWLSRLNTFLSVDADQIGQYHGGKKKPTGIIDVAMIQSLNRKGVVTDIVGQYGQLIIDECHHIPASSFDIVTRQSKAKYVTGLSATVTRKDGHQPIVFMNCGPVRYRVRAIDQAIKRPFEHRVVIRETTVTLSALSETSESAAPTIHDLYYCLIHNEQRNQLIAADVKQCLQQGRSPVVLTERREHLKILEELLQPLAASLIVLTGGMKSKERRRQLSEFADHSSNSSQILLATGRYIGEGFDAAHLDTLFLTLPVSWRGTVAQYAGRLHRVHADKQEVRIYDYVDSQIPMAAKMYQRRAVGYRSLGYDRVSRRPETAATT